MTTDEQKQLPPTEKPKQLLTNSRMSAFKECPRKHFYLYEAGIRTVKTEPPLRFGSQFHRGLEIYNKTGDLESAIKTAIQPYQFYPAWIQEDADKARFDDERTVLIELLAAHVDYWERAGETVVIDRPESVFRVPIRNPITGRESRNFDAAGQRDGIGLLKGTRRVLVEYKTTSSDIDPESVYWQRLMIDPQISLYFLATLQEGEAIDGVLYDVTRKPQANIFYRQEIPELDENALKIIYWKATGERVLNKDGSPAQRAPSGQAENVQYLTRPETFVEHSARIRADIDARPQWYFQRREITRTPAELEEFQQELWHVAQQIRYSQLHEIHPKNGNICFRYYGSRPCPYWDICTTGRRLEQMSDADIAGAGFERLDNIHPELIAEDRDQSAAD